MTQKKGNMSPARPTPEPTTETGVTRRALKVGLLATVFGLIGRASARAQDALTIAPDGATIYAKYINFGSRFGALLTLFKPGCEFGVQPGTVYARSTKNFAWYVGGSYVGDDKNPVNPGTGGATAMTLSAGGLTVSDKFVGKGDATVEKGLTVNGTVTGKGDATLGKSLAVAGGVATQATAGKNTLDVQRAERTNVESHATALALYVTATSAEAGKLVEFRDSNATQGIGFGYNTIYATGSNGNQPLRLMARGNANVEIVRPGPKHLAVAGGVEALRIIRGVVNGNGKPFPGTVFSGFSVTPRAGGQANLYDIAFADPFPAVPAAFATQIFGNLTGDPGHGSSTSGDTANIVQLRRDGMRVATFAGSGRSSGDRAFSFAVIGPQPG